MPKPKPKHFLEPDFNRKRDVREEKQIQHVSQCIVISFRDLVENQPKKDQQTIASWIPENLIVALIEKFRTLSSLRVVDAITSDQITIYPSGFPSHSEFRPPSHLEKVEKWAVIKHIGGQKARVAGYLIDNVFHVVFL